VLGNLNNETLFVLKTWGFPEPEILEHVSSDDTVSIVDTNNPQELFENINDASIAYIVDHHKLVGGLATKKPIEVVMRPLASTVSVIHDYIREHAATMPREIKGLVLSGILSDTLAFRSPTTTPHDTALAETLAKELSVSITEYSQKMFEAKSDIGAFSDEALIKIDSKKFAVGTKNCRVSVIETAAPHLVLARKTGLITAIKSIVASEGDIDDVLLFIVDILNESATVFTYNELTTAIIEKSFGVHVTGDTHELPGIVSRKAQIVPVHTI
jgi:manganese-dependent inorganic pyrophosphatase